MWWCNAVTAKKYYALPPPPPPPVPSHPNSHDPIKSPARVLQNSLASESPKLHIMIKTLDPDPDPPPVELTNALIRYPGVETIARLHTKP